MTDTSTSPKTTAMVSDVMTGPVYCLDVDQPIEAAARMIRNNRVGEVVVTEAGRAVGVVSNHQLSAHVTSHHESVHKVMGEICPTNFPRVSPDDDVRWAAQVMSKHGLRRVPACSGDSVVGFVSMSDIIGHFDADDWSQMSPRDSTPSPASTSSSAR